MRVSKSTWLPSRREEVPLSLFQREISKVFDDFFPTFGLRSYPEAGSTGSFMPKIDVIASQEAVTVRAEVPGLTEKDFNISITEDQLVLKGEKKLEHKQEEGGTHYYESSYGMFERIIPLNFEVDKDKVEATLKKGILQIKLPRSAKAQERTRQISVRAE